MDNKGKKKDENGKDFNHIVDKTFALFEEVEPESIDVIKDELRVSNIDTDAVSAYMAKQVKKLITQKRMSELRKRITLWLEKFREEILSPQFLQSAPAYVTRLEQVSRNEKENDYEEVVQLVRLKKYSDARTILESLVEKPDCIMLPKYRYTLAHVYMALDMVKEAIEQFETIEGHLRDAACEIARQLRTAM